MPAETDRFKDTGYKLQEETLTIRDHLDPDKHWIGEALAVPTQTEIAATVGSTSSPGDSPFVARADHTHKVSPSLLPGIMGWNPTLGNITVGTGGTTIARAIKTPITPTLYKVDVQHMIVFGTGTVGPTGDYSITLPVTPLDVFVGYGNSSSASGRFNLIWYGLTAGAIGCVVRPLNYKPTATETNRAVESTVALGSVTPAITWAQGNWIQLYGSYLSNA
jgi:hypothetical protein